MCTRQADFQNGVDAGNRSLLPTVVSNAPCVIGQYRTRWGAGTVAVRQGQLVGATLPSANELVATRMSSSGEPTSGEPSRSDRSALERWVRELEEYFRGERLAWSSDEVPLDGLGLGEFERIVYATLLSVPPAVTVSYGVLAEMAGHPRAARAVGNAMAANPLPVIVPCHRVIRADGSLGNYGNDPAWKERLLSHEQTHLSAVGAEGKDE